MENRSCVVEIGWACSGENSVTKDACSEICGDGVDAAVKDGAAIVYFLKLFDIITKHNNFITNSSWMGK